MYIPIVLWLCDLVPKLRMQIMKTEIRRSRRRTAASASEPFRPARAARSGVCSARGGLDAGGRDYRESDIVFAIQEFAAVAVTEAFISTAEAAKRNGTSGSESRVLVLTGLGSIAADPQTDRNRRRDTRAI